MIIFDVPGRVAALTLLEVDEFPAEYFVDPRDETEPEESEAYPLLSLLTNRLSTSPSAATRGPADFAGGGITGFDFWVFKV